MFSVILMLASLCAATTTTTRYDSEFYAGENGGIPTLLAENPRLGDMPTGVAYVRYNFFTADHSQVMVAYFTPTQTHTWVDWGTSMALPWSSTGTSSEWHKGNGFTHFVVLSNLQLATKYFFRAGNDTTVYSFSTRAANQTQVTVGVWGDMGIENSANTIARIESRALNGEFDVALHIGDVSYGDDHFLYYQRTWFAWFALMQKTMASVPYMTLPGNHEHGSRDPFNYFDASNFNVYNHYFRMPPASTELLNASMFYSFNYGPIHFVQISTETSYPNAPWDIDRFGDQMSWLMADLAAANQPAARAAQPWIVVSGHRPIYSSSEGYSDHGVPQDSPIPFVPINSATLQRTFEKIFRTFMVDLVFSGHVHSYERLYPTWHNLPVQTHYKSPPAPAYVIVGNAGSIEGLSAGNKSGWEVPQPSWSALRLSCYGYGILEANGGQSLTWRFHNATDDQMLDTFTITK